MAVVLIGGLAMTSAGSRDDDKQRRLLAADTGISTTAAARHPSIPDSAMLQPEDVNGAIPTPAPDDLWLALRPPQPGPDNRYRSTVLRRTDRAVSVVIAVDDRPTVVVEYVATYRSNGAHRYLRELRRALGRCNGADGRDCRWTVLATGVGGNESMLLKLRENVEVAGEIFIKHTYLAVARVHRAVVVLADVGWETGDGHQAVVRKLITPAVRRAGTLH